MEQFELHYKRPKSTGVARADITVLEPGELPSWMWPGQKVVIATQPFPYDGLPVTNGANLIAHALLTKHGLGPFTGCVYVEHYTQEDLSEQQAMERRKPDFDVVRFRWEMVRCEPPYKLAPNLDPDTTYWWIPVPEIYYPPLLEKLEEPIPPWVYEKIEIFTSALNP